ncbi:hypothetical protein BU23DRAFT_481929 [Bimuria novae-zelandiae CBS 107.79]|uniref:Zn(2)-C6 fungal-type domain-containing protein n=1 Tax=Bimuria novae-zelandiae CBS 107.79 TaxID=1447943 RepID=A0A6A5UTA4_9PLEO|nr:hypothetical protein BU23DRAFT_481929 [Bimuria novae-zelandiae CBS 107.79]
MSLYRRACNACTASKRRCSKKVPTCARCAAKGTTCVYPSTRRDDVPHQERSSDERDIMAPIVPIDDALLLDGDFYSVNSTFSTSELLSLGVVEETNALVAAPNTPWFMALDSWNIEHPPLGQTPEYIGEESLSAYVEMVQDWLRRWVTENNCPLIHRELYRMHMPRCIQEAFTLTTTYLNRSPANKTTVFRIIEERADELVQQHVMQITDTTTLTLAEHLARVQALLIFQIIRLFDGDIRMRARGEAHSPILASWNTLLWQAATTSLLLGDPSALVPGLNLSVTPWKAWCFIESIRRTWLTTSILQSVYTTLRDSISPCPGGVTCTFGNGLWEAGSEHEWERRVVQGESTLFMPSLSIANLLVEASVEDVDEFGHAIMLITHGAQRMDKWVAENRVLF